MLWNFVRASLLSRQILRRIDAPLESDGGQALMHQHNRDVNLAGDRASRLTPTRDAGIVGSSGRVCCKASHFLRHQLAVWAPALHQAIRRTVFDDPVSYTHLTLPTNREV